MSKYDDLGRDALIRLLERRDRERQLGLVWERDDLEPDEAINSDYVALDLDQELSQGRAPWRNLIIEGDNYDALRALRMTHAGRIGCIYIDPPYNTGNRDFVYNDRFLDKTHRYRHSLWLDFIYRRLMLARELLTDDGIIFVSIDDNELFRLGMLMDRIFGPDKKLACFVWQTAGNFDNQAKVKICHEYILAYCYNPTKFPMPRVVDPNIEETSKLYRREIRNTIVKNGPKNPISEIEILPGFPAAFREGRIPPRTNKWPHIDKEIVVRNGLVQNTVCVRSGWANRDLCQRFIENNFRPVRDSRRQWTRFELTQTGAIENVKQREQPSHVISVLRNLGNVQSDGAELKTLGIDFNYPKPLALIKYLISLVNDKQVTVLDFFAGSGTTGHAVLSLNEADGGKRRFILVSNTEVTDDAPDKNLCRDVCAKRVRLAITGSKVQNGVQWDGLKGNFAYVKTGRIPPHRMSQRLQDAEVWQIVQMMHGFDLSPWPQTGFVGVAAESGGLAYLADFKADNARRLSGWAKEHGTIPITIYSWAPERAARLVPQAEHRPIPEFLRERFGQGVRRR